MAVGNTSEAKPPIRVVGGNLGWQVVTSGGRWRNTAEPWQERRSAPDGSDVQKET